MNNTDIVQYGIWSGVSKKFVFGIMESSKSKAWKKLYNTIGNDARKYRFEARKIKDCHLVMFKVKQ